MNLIGENLKIAKALANEIDKITDEDSDEDLYVASENAITLNKSIELIDLLKKSFMVKDIGDFHHNILSLP